MEAILEILFPFIVKGVVSGIGISAFFRIIQELMDAAMRTYKKPTRDKKEILGFIIVHQVALVFFLLTVMNYTIWSQPKDDLAWPELIIGAVYFYMIRRVANIDTRIKKHQKQIKKAAKAALTTPTEERDAP